MFELEEIKRRRKKLGLTQKELAELVGVSQPLIARIESGTIDPKLSLVKRIFEVLDELEGKKIEARSVMNSPVIYATPETPLRDVMELMMIRGISQMPVLKSSKIVGSITESSIIRAILSKGKANKLKVRDCMDKPFPTVSPSERLEVLSKLLLENPAVLVVDGGKVVGIITKQDVMKILK
jgi:predicted transcriptional regulator